MKRFILAALAAALFTGTSQAGPIRNWLASRHQCQPCQTPAVQYAQPQYTPGPVQQFAGTVLVQTGAAVQHAGQVVQAYQPAGFSPVVRTCGPNGCR